MKKPIILIPGIQGTTLTNVNDRNFEKVFSGIKKYFRNVQDIELQQDGVSDKGTEIIIERSDVEDLAYTEIVNYLRKEGYRVYIFGYDWRMSNMDTARELAQFVERLSQKLKNTNQFNFLTHSMGGVVLSAYMKLLGSEKAIAEVVNKAIMTVPPFLGSTESVYNLVIGRSRLVNSSDDFRKIARTFPSIYELCPVYPSAFKFSNNSRKRVKNFYNFHEYWQHQPKPSYSSAKDKNELMVRRFKELGKVRDQGKNFIFDFNKLSPKLRKCFTVLVGSNRPTMESILIRPKDPTKRLKNFFDFEHFKENKRGDGTVHHASSTIFKKNIETIEIKSKLFETRWNSHLMMNDWHAFFLNNGRVQNIIKRGFKYSHKELHVSTWYNSNKWFYSPGGGIKQL